MKIEESVVELFEKEIEELLDTDGLMDSDDKLGRLNILLGILSRLKGVQVSEAQLSMFSQTQEAMKEVDFSKLDLNGMMNMLKGK